MTETLWIALLIALTMGATRLAKLWPKVPKGFLPVLALVIGAAAYLAKAVYVDGQTIGDAWQSWLVVLVGAGAVVGHDLLKPALTEWLGDEWATLILGRLPAKRDEPKPPKPPPPSVLFVGLLALALLPGCVEGLTALRVLSAASQGAQWLGTVLDVASSGSEAYFARHPQRDRQLEVEAALRAARQAAVVLDGALAAGADVASEDYQAARAHAIETYADLRALLDEVGVLDARAPDGGAIGDAPPPGPVTLPTVPELYSRL